MDVTLVSYNQAGRIYGVTHIDGEYADTCIRQLRNSHRKPGDKFKIFRCDDQHTNYEKFHKFMEQLNNDRQQNIMMSY
jgi:hypothetical protein